MRADGRLVCFDSSGGHGNEYGQYDVPADAGPVLAVAAGHRYACAVRTDGRLVCFGKYDNDVPEDLGTGFGSRQQA